MPMTSDLEALSFRTGSVFTPGAPINEKDLFAGRAEQVEKIVDVVSQRGCHAILYGERGVGKTSLSNMIAAFLARRLAFVISRTNCNISDSFSSLWTKALKDIEASRRQPQVGFSGQRPAPPPASASEAMTPDGVRRALQELSTTASLIIIFDEFDRIRNTDVITAMADTIKALSDNSVNATILIIGVADSVNDLIREHQSIERALVQIPMPRMSDDEIRGIIDKGLARLTMSIDSTAREDIVLFSQGVPYGGAFALHFCVPRGSREREENHLLPACRAGNEPIAGSVATIAKGSLRRRDPKLATGAHLQRSVACLCAGGSRRPSLFHYGCSRETAVADHKQTLQTSQLRSSFEGPQRARTRPHSSACRTNVHATLSNLESDPETIHHHARHQGQSDHQGANFRMERRGGLSIALGGSIGLLAKLGAALNGLRGCASRASRETLASQSSSRAQGSGPGNEGKPSARLWIAMTVPRKRGIV